VILSNGFPRLRICTAFDIGALAFNTTWTGSSALHTLNLNLKTTFDCEQLRSVCPQLRRLTTYESSIVLDRTKSIIFMLFYDLERVCVKLPKFVRESLASFLS
jgi:hypothetical protein